jgi:hypothetical protein
MIISYIIEKETNNNVLEVIMVPRTITVNGTICYLTDYKQVYNGKDSGFCMCGCNGKYTDDPKALNRAWNKLNKMIELFPGREIEYEAGNYIGMNYPTPAGNMKGLFFYTTK